MQRWDCNHAGTGKRQRGADVGQRCCRGRQRDPRPRLLDGPESPVCCFGDGTPCRLHSASPLITPPPLPASRATLPSTAACTLYRDLNDSEKTMVRADQGNQGLLALPLYLYTQHLGHNALSFTIANAIRLVCEKRGVGAKGCGDGNQSLIRLLSFVFTADGNAAPAPAPTLLHPHACVCDVSWGCTLALTLTIASLSSTPQPVPPRLCSASTPLHHAKVCACSTSICQLTVRNPPPPSTKPKR